MRLLHLVTTYQSCVTILDAKLRRLAQDNAITLHVASSFEDPAEKRESVGLHYSIPMARTISPLSDLAAIYRTYKYMRFHRFDIVHTHTAKAGIIGTVAAWLARVPVICHTYHGLPYYTGQGRLKNWLYHHLEADFSRLRTVMFSQNQQDFIALKNDTSIRGPVLFEGNGVDAARVDLNAQTHTREVQRLFKPNRLKLICVARLEAVKRLEKVVAAVKYLKENSMPVHCLVAGKGELAEWLNALIKSEGLADDMEVVYTPHIHALIGQTDIAVLTSEKEGIPRGLMEAMALCKPVVATDVPGTRELVLDGETGFLASLNDQTSFNTRLMELAHSPVLRERFGKAGCKRILEQFDDAKAVGLWKQTYGRYLLTKEDFSEIARLHAESIPMGFLSMLGKTFLSRLYKGIARHPESCVIVARDEHGRVAGFVSGTLSVRRCYRGVLRKRFLSLCLLIVFKMFSPANLKRAWETLRYPAKQEAGERLEAELLSIAVSDSVRGKGVGKKLVAELETWFAAMGCYAGPYKVVTSAEDARSNGFYKSVGFEFQREFMHHGKRMNEYVHLTPLSPLSRGERGADVK
ncbi:MAG: GNAT family N-acetyltransferase [Fibrobacterota bacterium]